LPNVIDLIRNGDARALAIASGELEATYDPKGRALFAIEASC
jgi:hypothetical protein